MDHKRAVWLFETGLALCLADFAPLPPPPPPKEALRWFLKGSHEDFPFKRFLFSLATHGFKCVLFILYRMCVIIKVIYSITYKKQLKTVAVLFSRWKIVPRL
jgi:hypothetical protein